MQLPAFRIAVGLLLLAHATFGCVWCHSTHEPASSAAMSAEDSCCESHDALPCLPGHHEPGEPCPTHLACQVRCIYLPTESVLLDDQMQLHGFADALPADPILAEALSVSRIALDRSDGANKPGSLPRHLLFQLLLI